jgi:hypothetical protein
VLHNYPLAASILRSPNTLGIVLVRRPQPTVQSIVNMGLHYSDIAWYRDLDAVARYYEERLAALVGLADALRGRVVFIEAESLLARTLDVLQGIGNLLKLSEPLRPDYRRFAHTGEGGFGDPGEVIATGRVTTKAREQRTSVMLPNGLVSRLETAYATCSASLRDRCEALAA